MGKQVQRTRAQWKATDHSFVCSEHLTDDSFEVDLALASKFGLKKRRRLKPESVPTIFYRSHQTDFKIGDNRRAPGSDIERRRGVVEKRQQYEVKVLSILAFFKLNQYRLSIKFLLDHRTFQLSVKLRMLLLKSNQMMNLVLNTTMYQRRPVFTLAKEMCELKYCQKQASRVRDSYS